MKSSLLVDLFKFLTFTSLLGLSGCGGGIDANQDPNADRFGSTINQDPDTDSIDTSMPTLLLSQSFAPPVIDRGTTIVLTFSESMDTDSLQLDGNLSLQSNGGLWIKSNDVSDTLTIAPQADTNWSEGSSYRLVINANDLAGNPLRTLSLDFDVKSGAFIYVNAAMADDTGDGLTPNTAHKFIHTAVTAAQTPATVLVAQGEYDVSHAENTHVVLKEGVSLYGGYDVSFTYRNSAENITAIREISGESSPSLSAAIEGDLSDITEKTVIDGFSIEGNIHTTSPIQTSAIYLVNGASPTIQNNTITGGHSENYSYGLYNSSASPTIRNNIIHGGESEGYSYGIHNSNSSPAIRNNAINGGNGGTYSYGVSNSSSSPLIQNNIIDGGNGRSLTSGIDNSDSSPTIQNNTINGGSGTNRSYSIYDSSSSSSSPTIENNILFTRSGDNAYCIYHASDVDISSVLNNDLVFCNVKYYDSNANCSGNADGDDDSKSCSVGEMNILAYAGENISVDPRFADLDGPDNTLATMDDNNWHFSANTPSALTQGGLNGRDEGWSFTNDKDGVERPQAGFPWAIGAYEP
jgi:hypothetical protein